MIETITRTEWLARNPILQKFIATDPTGWINAPAFTIWPDPNEIDGISDHQREQLNRSFVGRIGMLGGSPGTGKTYTVAKLITHLLDSGAVADYDIGIGAPTGKAAVRLTEMLQANDLPLRARTAHSMLGIGTNSEAGGWTFRHNENNPWPYRLLIFDEWSMADLSLMLAIFRARPVGCHILIVGDVNQLPPVGAGAPLRDLIAAGLPYGELREIKRNSGGIVEACASIRDCKPWTQSTKTPDSNLTITEDQQENKAERVLEIINSIDDPNLSRVWDCQVLVAVNESSPLCRKEMNKILQDELNPGRKHQGTIFRIRDKVVCLKNGFYKREYKVSADYNAEVDANEKDEVYVANGELGCVVDVSDDSVFVNLENPSRTIKIPIRKQSASDDETASAGALANWDLGYALSVHKSQGSEWPIVIVILDAYSGARMICDRAWLYTAISRGKSKVHLVGTSDLADRFCRTQKISHRKTFLKELIGIEQCKKGMSDL